MIIIVKAASHENNKLYPQYFSDEYACINYKIYIMIELTVLKLINVNKTGKENGVMFGSNSFFR